MLYLVVPVYNEEPNIRPLLRRLRAVPVRLTVLFVDSHSTDRTVAEIRTHRGNRVRLIQEPQKRGLGSAYLLGFTEALKDPRARFICEMDADLSHDPAMLPRFLDALKDADIVLGSRYIRGGKITHWPLSRRLISLGGSWLGRAACRFRVKDVTSGFRMYRRSVLKGLDLSTIHSQGYAFQLEMMARAVRKEYRIKEVPITFTDRVHGRSKLGSKDFLEYVKTLLRFLF